MAVLKISALPRTLIDQLTCNFEEVRIFKDSRSFCSLKDLKVPMELNFLSALEAVSEALVRLLFCDPEG